MGLINMLLYISHLMVYNFFSDAHRALELLEDYHTRLNKPQDRPLKHAIERVIRIFKSRLFQALLGKFHTVSTAEILSICFPSCKYHRR